MVTARRKSYDGVRSTYSVSQCHGLCEITEKANMGFESDRGNASKLASCAVRDGSMIAEIRIVLGVVVLGNAYAI